MRTRMQSMANIFNKINRVVRDLSGQLGKSIDLEIEGKDVELDKTGKKATGSITLGGIP